MRMQCVPGLLSPPPRRPGDEAKSALCPRFWLITSDRGSYNTTYGSDSCKQTT